MRSDGISSILSERKATAEMKRTALLLKEPETEEVNPLAVCFLTGEKYIHQTIFCAHSLELVSKQKVRPLIFDDGSLTQNQIDHIHSRFPLAQIQSSDEILENLDAALPISKFPSLRSRRLIYPHLRKITDIHVNSDGWKLVLDSDMLFFKKPDEILEWLQLPEKPLCMQDVMNSYGHSLALMKHLCGEPIPSKVNVGVCGIDSTTIDWEQLEYWCKRSLEIEGPQYTQEQALVAMMFAQTPFTMLPADTYICLPSQGDVQSKRGILHHYVAESKEWYLQQAWQLFCPERAQQKELLGT
jgi:hypothetical protein